ncbi:MAG: hypothetical protein P4L83_05330 [Nevskia sp.]|nr:hypothetical protein [Nevskia sp.]
MNTEEIHCTRTCAAVPRPPSWPTPALLAALLAATLTACGGSSGGDPGSSGSSSGSSSSSGGSSSSSGAGALSLTQRISAATQTAETASLCMAVTPFYWEIGYAGGSYAAGSVGGNTYTANSPMAIASASKWMYSSYVVQAEGGKVTATDIPFLHFTSGYTNMHPGGCAANPVVGPPQQTIDECLAQPGIKTVSGGSTQGSQDNTTAGFFYYNSGHMTHHASAVMGLGHDTTADLTSLIQPVLEQGSTFGTFEYTQVDMAGGVATTPADYAIFLRNILNGKLAMLTLLGSNAVCTNPSTCPTALYSPIDGSPGSFVSNESWHYSLGHWVEDDPTPQPDGSTLGDGAFSSPGAFGFYPWIDAGKTYYGILARKSSSESGEGLQSAACGRMIRKAFLTGNPQLAPPVEPAS